MRCGTEYIGIDAKMLTTDLGRTGLAEVSIKKRIHRKNDVPISPGKTLASHDFRHWVLPPDNIENMRMQASIVEMIDIHHHMRMQVVLFL